MDGHHAIIMPAISLMKKYRCQIKAEQIIKVQRQFPSPVARFLVSPAPNTPSQQQKEQQGNLPSLHNHHAINSFSRKEPDETLLNIGGKVCQFHPKRLIPQKENRAKVRKRRGSEIEAKSCQQDKRRGFECRENHGFE